MDFGLPYTAAALDESGQLVAQKQTWTATTAGGVLQGSGYPVSTTCRDWTSADASAGDKAGIADFQAADLDWSSTTIYSGCGAPNHVLCMQTGGGPELPPALLDSPPAKKAFHTSVSGTGDLGSWTDAKAVGAEGIAAGDAVCAARAAAAGLHGSYKAWLSDGTTNAIDRLASNGPWVRVDGAAVAADKAGLASGAVLSGLVVDEQGEYPTRTQARDAWTGTNADGAASTQDCAGWASASSSDNGVTGVVAHVGSDWTQRNSASRCDAELWLYCFED